MEMLPIELRLPVVPAGDATIRVERGVSRLVDAVAAVAAPPYRFLTRSWFAAAATTPVQTLLAIRDGVATIALPVARGPLGLRQVPGAYWPFRSFPVAAGQRLADMTALLRDPAARRTLGRAWRLGPVSADDPGYRALAAAARAGGWTLIRRRVATGHRLALPDAGDGFPRASTLKKNRFHEKHLATHGVLDWSFHRGADWTPALVDALAAIEAKSWQGGSTDAKFLGTAHRRVWQALAADRAQAARMNVALLRVDGVPAAYSFDIDSGPVRYAIANSYDPAFAKHSPGKCLYYRNIVDGQARGIRTIDWGAGDSGYKATIGAKAGAELVDILVLRGRTGRLAAALLGPLWARSGQPR